MQKSNQNRNVETKNRKSNQTVIIMINLELEVDRYTNIL